MLMVKCGKTLHFVVSLERKICVQQLLDCKLVRYCKTEGLLLSLAKVVTRVAGSLEAEGLSCCVEFLCMAEIYLTNFVTLV